MDLLSYGARLVLLAACLYICGCQARPGILADPRDLDPSTEMALRGAILGNPAMVARAASTMGREPTEAHRRASSAASILAASTARPVPTKSEARDVYTPVSRTQVVRAWELLKNKVEPRERWIEARADRRYDALQRTVDGVFTPVAHAFQGQFFSLIALPFTAADWLVVGRVYLTPEQRKELQAARRVVSDPVLEDPRARSIAEEWRPRRRRLGALQARRNGSEALEKGDLQTALFWFERESALLEEGTFSAGLEKARQLISEERLSIRRSLSMTGADARFSTRGELASYGTLLRVYTNTESRSAFVAESRVFKANNPWSHLIPILDAAQAGLYRADGEKALSTAWLRGIISGESAWSDRAGIALTRPEFDPLPVMEDGKRRIDTRRNEFLLKGRDPWRRDASWTPEEARRGRAIWVDRARALFVTDILARLLFLPFLDPIPRHELLDSAAQVDDAWFDRPEGRIWLERVARALVVERRYDAAVNTWNRLGESGRAESTAQRAARHLERLGDRAQSPRERAAIYQRVINAWPEYRRLDRVELSLEKARLRAEAVVNIPRAVLKSYPEFIGAGRLEISTTLLDGSSSNGEISREGIWILPWGAIVYQDQATDRDIEVPVPAENLAFVTAMLTERLRSAGVYTELRKPPPRRRIPLELEAGVFPGFDVAPGLVPLSPERRERELYE